MALIPTRRFALLALAALLLAGGPALAAAPAPAGGPVPAEMAMGNPKARVTMIEYASASCPHCARFNNDVFPLVKRKYIDTGKVRYVLREFLTEPVPLAAAGFLLARCSGEARYFSTLDQFFHAQAEIYSTGKALPVFVRIGQSVGMNEEQVRACITDQAAADTLTAKVEGYAASAGIDAVPTFLINGTKLEGEQPFTAIDAAVQAALKKKGG